MKKIAVFVSIASVIFTGNIALAGEHGAHCLNVNTGELKTCRIIISPGNNSIEIDFKSDKDRDASMNLQGNEITEISTGEYAKQRGKETIGASAALGPFGALVGAFHKEYRTQLAIEYLDDKNQKNVTMIDIPRKHSEPLKKDLEALTGLQIRGSESSEKIKD